MQNINKVVTRQSDKDYTKDGVVISNTKNTKTIITDEKSKIITKSKSNTCFKVKNIGCSGLAKEFFN